jgi:tRNA (cytidine/uridine-2'-O-)-methyltransferase
MFDIVLFEPEIPPNTGNILRLASNTGSRVHLVKPLGFRLSERAARRAGLDYAGVEDAVVHEDWQSCRAFLAGRRMFAVTTRATLAYSAAALAPGDVFVFGPETRGLPESVLSEFAPGMRLRLPMQPGSRSLNLSNAVAVTIFEAWRQQGFAGGS